MHRRFLVLFFLLLFLAPFRAHAQSAGDACSTAKQIVRVEGNQGPGLICNGSTLEVYESVNTGPLRKGIGLTSPASALDVNGGVRIGADSAACAAAKEGTIRYVAASDSYEFCNGSAWLLLRQSVRRARTTLPANASSPRPAAAATPISPPPTSNAARIS